MSMHRMALPAALSCSLALHLALLLLPFGPAASPSPASRPVLQLVIAGPAAEPALAPPAEIAPPAPINPEAPVEKSMTEDGSGASAPLPHRLPLPDTPPVMLLAPAIGDGMPFGEVQGFVVLELDIDPAGQVTDSRILDAGLDAAHAQAIAELARHIEFAPARRDGQAVAGRMIIRFEYRPAEPAALRYEWLPDYQPNAG